MKRLSTMALGAALLTAGAALAAGPVSSLNAGKMFIQPNATFAPPASFGFTNGGAPATSGPTTTNNDDSCDISVLPAATLLLPYFEVDIRQPANNAINTNFTITNVSNFSQVAHITIWTDRSFPVLDFNIYLTGYDVQGINLYDILARGQIPPTGSGTSDTATNVNSPRGTRSQLASANLNFIQPPSAFFAACSSLAGQIPGAPAAGSTTATGLLKDVQDALTIGFYSTCPSATLDANVGSNRGANALAIGYVTVDVANTCSQTLPTTALYYGTEILFDNVLIGDYQRINPRAGIVGISGDAGGNPMVHIRAIPEGGLATSTTVVNFPYTFYDRYTPVASRKADRRQPLPGTFAARFIEQPGSGGNLSTNLNIWREGITIGDVGTSCVVLPNATISLTEGVRFDEHENNATVFGDSCAGRPSPCIPGQAGTLPETSSTPTTNGVFPQLVSPAGDVGGWIYLNLNNGDPAIALSLPYGNARASGAPYAGVSQNWVTLTQAADAAAGRFSVEFDAAALGNGCSPRPAITSATGGAPAVGPAGGAVTGTNATP